jgi:hypothetical protein
LKPRRLPAEAALDMRYNLEECEMEAESFIRTEVILFRFFTERSRCKLMGGTNREWEK